jgi:hypothetical protein
MHIRGLPREKNHAHLFFNFKQPEESLGVALFSKDELQLTGVGFLNEFIKGFFHTGIDQPFFPPPAFDPKEPHIYANWQIHIEGYAKFCWLARDFIANNGFDYPMCTHWDPQESRWMIHPGGSRQVIVDLFHNGLVEIIAFNTTGVHCNWKQTFSNLKELEEYTKTKDIKFAVIADHETLIPHIHFNTDTIKINVEKEFEYIKDFFRHTVIQSDDLDVTLFGYDPTKVIAPKYIFKVSKHDYHDQHALEKIFLLLPNCLDGIDIAGVKIERIA